MFLIDAATLFPWEKNEKKKKGIGIYDSKVSPPSLYNKNIELESTF